MCYVPQVTRYAREESEFEITNSERLRLMLIELRNYVESIVFSVAFLKSTSRAKLREFSMNVACVVSRLRFSGSLFQNLSLILKFYRTAYLLDTFHLSYDHALFLIRILREVPSFWQIWQVIYV